MFDADVAIAHTLHQVIAQRQRKERPRLDLRHYSPKMNRPILSPNCFISSGSEAARKRSATSKKAFSFSFCASRPCSTNSTRTRLSLSRFLRAIRSTCSANLLGRVTLRRTCFIDFITPSYTTMVHLSSPSPAPCTTLPQTAKTTASRCITRTAPPGTVSPQTDSPAYPPPSTRRSSAPDTSPSPRHAPHIRPRSTSHPSLPRAA